MLVLFALEAVRNLEELISYTGQFSSTGRLNLLAAITAKVQLLEQQPEMCPVVAGRAPLRRCVVTPKISLYYHIRLGVLEILTIIDSRRDPDTLALPQ